MSFNAKDPDQLIRIENAIIEASVSRPEENTQVDTNLIPEITDKNIETTSPLFLEKCETGYRNLFKKI